MSDKKFLPAIIFLLGIIFSFGWYNFFCEPLQREILSMELETRRLREVEREILQIKARHQDLSAFIAAKELELDAAREFLPTMILQDKFIDELYRAADSCKVQLISVRAGETISAEEIQSQVVSVELEADYVSLLNFTREILDGERLTTLENFSVESAEGKILSCELNFKIFAAAP